MTFEQNKLFPATAQQEGIWLHSILNSTSFWNFVYCKCLLGNLNVDFLKTALMEVMDRQAILKTNFLIKDHVLFQIVNSEYNINKCFIYKNYNCLNKEDIKIEVEKVIKQEETLQFNLEEWPLFRINILDFNGKCVILFTINHIITDIISNQIFWDELITTYNKNIEDNGRVLPSISKHYIDYSINQQDLIVSQNEQLNYWLDKLNSPPVFELPFSNNSKQKTIKAEVIVEKGYLDDNILADIKNFSLKNRVLNSAVYLLAYYILLYKYSGLKKILVGNVVNGRDFDKKSYSRLMGLFVNRLVLDPGELNEGLLIKDLLNNINADLLKSFANQVIPYERMSSLVSGKGSGRLYQAEFNLIKDFGGDQAFIDLVDWDGLKIDSKPMSNDLNEITLNVRESKENVILILYLKVQPNFRGILKKLLSNYSSIIKDCITNPGKKISEIELLDGSERVELVEEFNNTSKDFSTPKLVHKLFELQASKTLQSAAIVVGKTILTYEELDRKSSQLAGFLLELGITRGNRVALLLNRSQEMIISILAVLKAGACYVPIDPQFPQERITYMLEDSSTSLILTQEILQEKVIDSGRMSIAIDTLSYDDLVISSPVEVLPEDLAYLIYTSGSTGKPKGVMIEHKSVVNFINGIREIEDFQSKTIVSLTTYSFDIFVLESLLALSVGAKVILVREHESADPAQVREIIEREAVDILQATPSRMKFLIQGQPEFLKNLKIIMIGGEPLSDDLLAEVKEHTNATIYNMYGPTETTVWSTVKDLTYADKITIGKPLANTQAYIVSPEGQLQPTGAYGELCLAGEGVARGYWGKEELTKEKFIPNPFEEKGTQLYKTGDIGRWLPDGELELKGREDDQVKIRGYRIELGEIEFQLRKHPHIADAVVIKSKDIDLEELNAYYVSKEEINMLELRESLLISLPEYMVPSTYMRLDKLPTTPNNKVDKNALPQIKIKTISSARDIINENEGIVQAIMTNLLGVSAAGVDDNFFTLGGNSLKAIVLLSRIEEKFNIAVPYIDFANNPTIRGLFNIVSSRNVNQKKVSIRKDEKFFFGEKNHLFGFYQEPDKINNQNISIILSTSLLSEQINSYHSLRYLSKQLITNGFPVFTFDYYGCGDSYGFDEEVSVNECKRSLREAIQKLKSFTSGQKIYLITLRFGGIIALDDEILKLIDGIVLLEPFFEGKAYLKEMNGIHKKWVSGSFAKSKTDMSEIMGFNISKHLIKELSSIKIKNGLEMPKTLVISKAIKKIEALRKIISPASTISLIERQNHEFWLKQSNDEDKRALPYKDVDQIISWILK